MHPDPTCLALAQRRRAFGRALRLTGVPDTGELVEYVSAVTASPANRSGEGRNQGRTTDMGTR